MIPATVKTPPIIAQTPVKKWVKDRLVSVNLTMIGEKSYKKNTPNIKENVHMLFWFISILFRNWLMFFLSYIEWKTWKTVSLAFNFLWVLSYSKLIRFDHTTIERFINGRYYFNEILIHCWTFSVFCWNNQKWTISSHILTFTIHSNLWKENERVCQMSRSGPPPFLKTPSSGLTSPGYSCPKDNLSIRCERLNPWANLNNSRSWTCIWLCWKLFPGAIWKLPATCEQMHIHTFVIIVFRICVLQFCVVLC